ncbi:MAG: ABC transporter permease [Myxococcota bacterium]
MTAAVTEQPIAENRERGESLGRRAARNLRRDRTAMACFVVIAAYVGVALLGYTGLLPDFQERVGGSYEPPSLSFAKILGTDIFGRSILYKILAGTETAMTIGFIVTGISLPIGITLGALAGYYGGRIDAGIVWLYSVISSVPSILLIVGISYVFEKGIVAICIALGAVSWVGLCRLIRGEVLKHRNREYVLAVRLLGAGDAIIIFRHILPNVIHLAIVTASLLVLSSIKSEVILTFLGVGIQDGASWGTMITDATGELVTGIWWPLAGVTTAMFVIIYALNVAGDALRDALDPKLID